MQVGIDKLELHPIVESPEEVSNLTSAPSEFIDIEEKT